MTNLQRRPLVQGERLYVRKSIKWNGKVYSEGTEFPYKRMAISWRDVVKLRGAGKLMGADELELSNIDASPTKETKDFLIEERIKSEVGKVEEGFPRKKRRNKEEEEVEVEEEEVEEEEKPKKKRRK